jgi:hypothetical protein
VFPLLAALLASSLEPALADAKSKHTAALVLVDVTTTMLANDAAPKDTIVIRADSADCAPLRIIAAPAIVWIGANGKELGRIEGRDFASDDDVQAAVVDLIKHGDAVANLSARIVAAPTPAERARLGVELAHEKLARGDESALSELERVITADPDPNGAAAEEALFVMAAYRDRVLHEAGVDHIWRELFMRFPNGKHAKAAASAYLTSLRVQKKDALAAEFEKAHPVSP